MGTSRGTPWLDWEIAVLKEQRENQVSFREIRDNFLPHRTSASLRALSRTVRYDEFDVEGFKRTEAYHAASEVFPPFEEEGVKVEEDGTMHLCRYLDKSHPTSLQELLAAFDVDPDEWEVKRHEIRAYPVPVGDGVIESGWYSKASLEPFHELIVTREMITDQVEDAKRHAPQYTRLHPDRSPLDQEDCLLEVDIFDHHFGMYAWSLEVDGPSYDLAIARALFLSVAQELKAMTEIYPVSRILLPLGQDLLHYDFYMDGKIPVTTAGTPQDADTRRKLLYTTVRRLMVEYIDLFRTIAPVDVVIVPGNHDTNTAFTLGDALECWYRNDEEVQIDNDPKLRKYYPWGTNLIGFTHGKDEPLKRLPMLMATEAKQLWANSEYREWHLGHKHRQKVSVPVFLEDHGGVLVRELPSLCPPDSWHYARGFTLSTRGSKAFLWRPEGGVAHEFTLNVGKYREV